MKRQNSLVLGIGLKHPIFSLTFVGNETKHVKILSNQLISKEGW